MAAHADPPVYLDYNATAPVLPAVQAALARAVAQWPGNPSSPHAFGQAARSALEDARDRIAQRLGVSRRELIFTSGGSEANNQALRTVLADAGPAHVIVSPVEHPSVLRAAERLADHGVALSTLPVDADGRIVPQAIGGLLRAETRLVSVMAANNETGVLQPLPELVAQVRAHQGGRHVPVHCDAVQAFGRVAFAPWAWGLDLVTVTAHKLGGPKGIGALAFREGTALPPLVAGGAQERGHRAGTESVFLAEGFAVAVEWVFAHFDELAARLTGLREQLLAALRDEPGFFLTAAEAPRLPNTLHLGFAGVDAESLVIAMDLQGVALSMGSACSSGALEPSHVLAAMGLPEAQRRAALRISMGHATTAAEVARAAETLRREVRRLRKTAARRAS